VLVSVEVVLEAGLDSRLGHSWPLMRANLSEEHTDELKGSTTAELQI